MSKNPFEDFINSNESPLGYTIDDEIQLDLISQTMIESTTAQAHRGMQRINDKDNAYRNIVGEEFFYYSLVVSSLIARTFQKAYPGINVKSIAVMMRYAILYMEAKSIITNIIESDEEDGE